MSPTPEQVFALIHDRPGAVWLDGGRGAEGWSILAWAPVEVVTDGAGWPAAGRRLTGPASPSDLPFTTGVIGYLGYGAGHRVEAVPPEPRADEEPRLPEVWLGRYEGALCYRHADRTWHPTGRRAVRRAGERLLAAARPLPGPPPAPVPTARHTPSRSWFEAGVRRIQEWIAAGDCYQVNLTRPVRLEGTGPAWPAWRRLRILSDARYGAFLRLDGAAVLSNSPELFLGVRGDRVLSQPIKGTRPRAADPERDAALGRALERSPKDRAELAMIVDLVRNDLGRLAVPGTVAAGPRTLTAHATVHHAHVDVTAVLEPGRDAWDALAATFPPGSVTGAPKIRACERIAQLETGPRGVYCGAIGFASASGTATFSVAIRTAVAGDDRVRYHVGGGIVADSDPAAEWRETEHKGAALEAAFAAPDRDSDVSVPAPRPRP